MGITCFHHRRKNGRMKSGLFFWAICGKMQQYSCKMPFSWNKYPTKSTGEKTGFREELKFYITDKQESKEKKTNLLKLSLMPTLPQKRRHFKPIKKILSGYFCLCRGTDVRVQQGALWLPKRSGQTSFHAGWRSSQLCPRPPGVTR